MTSEDVQLERTLTAQLHQRAAAASPPPDAWNRFVAAWSNRAADPVDVALDTDALAEPVLLELGTFERRDRRRRMWWSAVAVAAGVAVLAIGLVVANHADEEIPEADETPAARRDAGVDAALSVMDAYFAAFESGDIDAVMALFTPSATFSDLLNVRTRDQFEAVTAWDIAQGSVNVSPECSARAVTATVEVSCVYGNHQYLARAVGAPPVEVTVTASITADGITRFRSEYESDDYAAVNFPFIRWVIAAHPDDQAAADCCGGSTLEESLRNGELRARYADEWAAYLEANDCTYETYDTDCPAVVDEPGGDPNDGGGSSVDQTPATIVTGASLRPLAELGSEDVVIPTVLPVGWTFSEPATGSRSDPWRYFQFSMVDREVVSSITVSMAQGPGTDYSFPGDRVELAGVSWLTPGPNNDLETQSGPNHFGVDATPGVERSLLEAFVSGLRAGPKSQFPDFVIEFEDDGTMVVTSGADTTESELVATNGDLRVRAVKHGDWVCVSTLPSNSHGRCHKREQFESTGIIEIDYVSDRGTLVIVGATTTATASSVEVRMPDNARGIAPTGGPNRIIDGQFFVVEVHVEDGLYEDGFFGSTDQIEIIDSSTTTG